MEWYALHVRSNCERLVSAALEASHVEAYYPARDRKALFPGYVFGKFDYERRRPVVSIPQIVRILGIGTHAVAIPEEEIEAVRQIVAAPPAVLVESHPFHAIGKRVIVTDGPLQGLEGTIAYLKGTCRVIVSVFLLHRSISAEVDADCLMPCPEAEPLVLRKAA